MCGIIGIVGTENVLHAAAEAGVERVTLASSGAVYAWHNCALVVVPGVTDL